MKCLLHSIAFGNLKLIVPESPRERTATQQLAAKLGIDESKLLEAADELLEEGVDEVAEISTQPSYPDYSYLDADDVSRTIHTMGTSLLDWVQDLHREEMFAEDARVFGLTSEGNVLAWKGLCGGFGREGGLEAVVRSIAAEFAPYGIRCNVLQPA